VRERGTPKPYHPSGAVLVIEVAASSPAVDLAVKAPLYASAAIAEYWVLDLDGARLFVHRDPRADGYGERAELNSADSVAAQALPLPSLRVSEALTAAD
jgi:Putative restriction endonuclease